MEQPWEILEKYGIDVLFPLAGWLIEGFEQTPEKQQVKDDRWYTKPIPLFLPKGHYWNMEHIRFLAGKLSVNRVWLLDGILLSCIVNLLIV